MYTYLHSKYTSFAVIALLFIGVSLHDTKLDSMTIIATALPVAIISFGASHAFSLSSEAHTHVERVSISELAGRYTAQLPKIKTRMNEDNRFHLTKRVPKGTHLFDSYSVPLA